MRDDVCLFRIQYQRFDVSDENEEIDEIREIIEGKSDYEYNLDGWSMIWRRKEEKSWDWAEWRIG